MNEEYMTVKSDDGKEHKCEILFTYFAEEYKHNYVVFRVEDTDELSAMIYVENGEASGTLHPIENDEEWEMLEEVVSKYLEEKESGHSCGCDCDHCSGCGEDHDCDCGCDHEHGEGECDCDHEHGECCHHHHE